jgi:hypothetical protein
MQHLPTLHNDQRSPSSVPLDDDNDDDDDDSGTCSSTSGSGSGAEYVHVFPVIISGEEPKLVGFPEEDRG